MTNDKIKLRQVCLVFIAFSIAIKIISLPALTATFANEGLWISAIFNFIIDGSMIFFFLKLGERFKGLTFFQILKENLGEIPTKIVLFLYFIYFILKAYVPIMEQKSFVEIALYETTHVVFIFLPIFLISCFFCYKGIKTVGRVADLSVWFTGFAVVVLICLSVPAANFSNLLPIIGVPLKDIGQGSFWGLLWYFDSTYILFFLGSFKTEKLTKTKVMLSYLACALVVTVFFAVLYSEFGPLTKRQYLAPVTMGKYYLSLSNSGRIDYVAGFTLALSCIFAVTTPLVFATLCLSHAFNFKHKIIPCLITNGIACAIFLTTQNYFFVALEIMQKYVVFFLLFMAYVFPLITLFFKKGRSKK